MLGEIAVSPKFSKLEMDIVKEVNFLAGFMSEQSLPVVPNSDSAFGKLAELPDSKKHQIFQYLKNLNYLCLNGYEPDPESPSSEYPEKKLVEKALSFFKLRLKNTEFWKDVQFSDLIEIYDENGYQIFRSFNFFHTCGYSLMDVLTNEWYVLWERPKFVLNAMLNCANEVLEGKRMGVTPMGVPTHIVKEIYSGTDAADFVPRSILVDFGNICPLYNDQDSIGGFILNSTCKIHTLGEAETRNVLIL